MCQVILNQLPTGNISTLGSWSLKGWNASSPTGPWTSWFGPAPTVVNGSMLLYQNQFIGTYNNNKIIEFNNALPGFWAFDYTVAGNPCGSGGATTSVVQVKKSCYSDDTVEYCTGDGATYNVESLLRDSYSGTCTSYYTGGTFTDNSGWGAGFNSTTGAFTPSSAPSPGTYSFSYDPSSDSSFPSAGFTVQSGCENCKMDLTVVVTQSYTAGISSRDHASPVIYDKLSGAAALLPHLYLSARDTSIASNPRWVYDGNDPAEIDTVLAGPTSGLQTTLTNVGADDLLYAGANMSINFWNSAEGLYGLRYEVGGELCGDSELVWVKVQCSADSPSYLGSSSYPTSSSPYEIVHGDNDILYADTLRGAVSLAPNIKWWFNSDENGGDPSITGLVASNFYNINFINTQGQVSTIPNVKLDFTNVPEGLYEFVWKVGVEPNCYAEESSWVRVSDEPPVTTMVEFWNHIGAAIAWGTPGCGTCYADTIMITSVIHDSTEYVTSPVLLEPYSGNHPSSCGGTHNTAFPLALASIGSPLTGGYSVNTVCSSPSDCGRWYTVCGVGDWSVTLYHGSDLWGAYGYKAWTRISNTGVEQSDDGVTWGPSSITTLSSHYLCAPITTIQGDITNPVSCS